MKQLRFLVTLNLVTIIREFRINMILKLVVRIMVSNRELPEMMFKKIGLAMFMGVGRISCKRPAPVPERLQIKY